VSESAPTTPSPTRDPIALIAVAISLFALGVTWFYSYQTSALELAPALTIECDDGGRARPDAFLALIPNKNFPGTHWGGAVPSPLYNDMSCVVSNYGRLPVLEVRVVVHSAFAKILADGKVQNFPYRNAVVPIDGIGAGQSATFVVRNTSAHLNADVEINPTVSFVRPTAPTALISYTVPVPFRTDFPLSPMNLSPAARKAKFVQNMP
jgi:hypothetical protein